MSNTVITIDVLEKELDRDSRAKALCELFDNWQSYRKTWLDEKNELLSYLFARDTKTTTNSKLPWRNNITVPKLTQIRDNLHANYMANLFPNSNWLSWEADSNDSDTQSKRKAIEYYTKNKLRASGFEKTVSRLVYDYIDYGNCYAIVEHVRDAVTSMGRPGYVGGRTVRISPNDIVFNPTAGDWYATPKIIQTFVTLGDLKKRITNDSKNEYLTDAFNKLMAGRRRCKDLLNQYKNSQLIKNGFGGIQEWYDSPYVELLDFYGDYYDSVSGELHQNKIITVVDRTYIARDLDNPSWNGRAPIHRAGWRERPDNLYAMGALDNLVGLQYQLDKLYNAKADVLDQTIVPFTFVKGNPETRLDNLQPFQPIYLGDDAEVKFDRPDVSAINLNADISAIEQIMEDMAGAPRQAMGIRTPGEKTKFEIQTLAQGGDRIFKHATARFEEEFLEPIINDILEVGRRNFDGEETIRMASDTFNIEVFKKITAEDLTGTGRLRAIAARGIAERANRLQEVINILQIAEGSALLSPHVKAAEAIKLVEQTVNIQPNTLFQEGSAIIDAVKIEQLKQSAQRQIIKTEAVEEPTFDEEAQAYAEMTGMDMEEEENGTVPSGLV